MAKKDGIFYGILTVFTGMLSRLFGPERLKTSDTFSSVTAGLAIRAQQGE